MIHFHTTNLQENGWQESLFSVKMQAISHFLQYINTAFPVSFFPKSSFQEQWPLELL